MAPFCPGEWMAAAGTAVAWPTTPGPERQDDYARNSFRQDKRSRKRDRVHCLRAHHVDPDHTVVLIVWQCIQKLQSPSINPIVVQPMALYSQYLISKLLFIVLTTIHID